MKPGSILLEKGRYRARVAAGPDDISTAQALRTRAFRTARPDRDDFDDMCTHVLIEDITSRRAAGCFRLLLLPEASGIGQSYSAQFYDLSAFERFDGRLIEIGRFCIEPGCNDADILRLAWGALTLIVDRNEIDILFGCSSFPGTDPEIYRRSFAWLGAHHVAPGPWVPGRKAKTAVPLGSVLVRGQDRREAIRRIPALLRTYLAMGGWVSDHAVVDRDMNTLHVFTAVEVGRIPPARKRLLREVAAG